MNAFGHKYECYIADTSQILSQQFTKTGFDAESPIWVNVPRITRSEPYTSLRIPQDYSYQTLGIKISSDDEIQMRARIPYSLAKKTGTKSSVATFTFHNLSEDTLSNISVGHSLSFSAGYDSIPNFPVVFTGTIQKIETSGNITVISAVEAGDTLKNVIFNKSYPANTKKTVVLRDIAREFQKTGVPLGGIEDSKRVNWNIGFQFNFNGNLAEVTSEFCKIFSYRYFISKNRLYFRSIDSPYLVDAVAINEESIIGNVKRMDDKTATTDADVRKRGAGVKFTTFMNGDIGLETPLRIMSGKNQGLYTPQNITFNLDYEKGPWSVDIDATETEETA